MASDSSINAADVALARCALRRVLCSSRHSLGDREVESLIATLNGCGPAHLADEAEHLEFSQVFGSHCKGDAYAAIAEVAKVVAMLEGKL